MVLKLTLVERVSIVMGSASVIVFTEIGRMLATKPILEKVAVLMDACARQADPFAHTSCSTADMQAVIGQFYAASIPFDVIEVVFMLALVLLYLFYVRKKDSP